MTGGSRRHGNYRGNFRSRNNNYNNNGTNTIMDEANTEETQEAVATGVEATTIIT